MNYSFSLYQKFSNLSNIIVHLLVLLFLICLFLPVRHVFLGNHSYLTGEFSDFTSFSLYLSDIIGILIIFFFILPRGKIFYEYLKSGKWLLICGFIVLFLNWSFFSAFFFIQLVKMIVAYGTVATLIHEKVINKRIIGIFVALCSLQSVLALWQFLSQSSLGLYKFGESHLSSSILGVAKIVSSGTTYIRGYGTFPHPNALSAFLVIGIVAGIYLIFQSKGKIEKYTAYLFTILNIFGLTVTFSRAGYIAAGISLIVFFFYYGIKNFVSRNAFISTLTIIVVVVISSFILFKPFLLTRATFSDNATKERRFYNNTGIEMIKDNPAFGVGIGESLLHMEQYSFETLKPWQKQPPHNYFIVLAAEMGLAMLVLVAVFLYNHMASILRQLKNSIKSEEKQYFFLVSMSLSIFFILMLFDHYFYTLEQTKLLLWIILGLVTAKKPLQ